jgi:arginine:pyruvate transaminase
MKLSARIQGILDGGDDGWGVFYKARAMKAAGLDVTELTIGEHDIRTDPSILDAMHAAAIGGHTGYADIPGTPSLRDAVAERVEAQTHMPTSRQNVLITPGGQAALFAAHMAACDDGDTALFIAPYYATYPGTIRSVGAKAVAVPARSRDGFQPDLDAVRRAAKGAKCLLINTPNNPTGVIYTDDTLHGLAEICRDEDLWLISDEVYDSQVWHGVHLSPRALPGMAERTLVVGSMSKSHAMTGSRLGWIIGPEDAIAQLATLAINTNYGVAGFIQDAALFALRRGPGFEADIAAPFRRRRDAATPLFFGQEAARLIPSDGAMYLMVDIRATEMSGEEFALRLLDEEHIAVMPGESFGHAAAGHIRIAMTIDDDRFLDAVERLVRFANTLTAGDTP